MDATDPPSIPCAVWNAALLVYIEFGPERRIPRCERLRAEFPELSSAEIDHLLAVFPTLERPAFDLAVAHREGRMTQEESLRATRDLHPLLADESASRLWNQAMYFAWREGS